MRKKSNVVYIGNFNFQNSNAAVERAMNNLRILQMAGNNCTICGFSDKNERIKIDGILIDCIIKPKTLLNWVKYLFSTKRYTKFIDKNNTIFILYNLPALLTLILNAKLSKRVKLVADVTEWYSTEGLNLIIKMIKKIDIWLRMKKLNKKMDGLIVISSYLEKYYKNMKNLVVIPPLVNDSIFDFKNNEKNKEISFIYSGFPGIDKDRLDLIIEAFVLLKERHIELYNQSMLTIIGITKAQFIKLFPSHKMHTEKISQVLNFEGSQTHERSIQALFDSDYSFILRDSTLKNNAGFPTKFSECKTIGIPIIYTLFSDIIKFTDKNDIFVEKLTSENVLKAIIECVNRGKVNRKERQIQLSIKNLKYVNDLNNFIDHISVNIKT